MSLWVISFSYGFDMIIIIGCFNKINGLSDYVITELFKVSLGEHISVMTQRNANKILGE